MLRLLEMVQQGSAALEQTVRLAGRHKSGGSGVFQYFHEGLEVTLDDAITAMIGLSDNTASNLLLDVTGIAPVNDLLDRLRCPGTRLHRPFGLPNAPGLPGPSQAVPAEIGRLLELLLGRDVLTPDLRDYALGQLRRQTHRALIPRLLPEGTPVAHKTGSLDGVRHDAGIFWRPAAGRPAVSPRSGGLARGAGLPFPPPGEPVVFVGMSRDVRDGRWTVENEAEVAIARTARAVYDALTVPSAGEATAATGSRRTGRRRPPG
jgi:beta-lactamase class A